MQAVLYIVHCNKVSKPVKSKYLLLCMNSIMYLLLTWYTFIMFLKVLSHLILKIKSFMKYFKKGVLKYLKIFMIFLNISKWNISSCISTRNTPLMRYRFHRRLCPINPLESKDNYGATSNNTKLVHWPLMGGLFVTFGTARKGLGRLRPRPTLSSL